MHDNVKRWTSKKGINLFDKDFIFVPINESSHWYLAVICFPGHALKEKFPDAKAFPQKKEAAEAQAENSSDSDDEEVPLDNGGDSAIQANPDDKESAGTKTIDDFKNR